MNRRKFLSLAASLSAWPITVHAATTASAVRRIRLKNAHTGETFEGPYRDGSGPIAGAMDDLSLFLRDHHCGAVTPMDVGVIDFLGDVLAAVGEDQATILSAYRTPETNAMLARTTFGVAEHSQHMYGRALDLFLGGKLAEAMTRARDMKRGGVGWYPRSNFIHIDTGPVRNWTLDAGGLDHLLLQGRPMMLVSGGRVPVVLRGGAGQGPLSVAQRLALHRQLAHAEFIARHR
jgi:uncharacterized protein YcbK (DUF882 family)